MADVFDQAAAKKPLPKHQVAQASAPSGGDVFDQAAARPAPNAAPPEQQGASIPPVTRMTNPKLNIAASGENMPEYVGATGALGAGLMGGAALGETPLIGPAMKWMARKAEPFAVPAAASYAINQARQLPIVGPVIKHIPFAEMLPWLIGGKGKAPEAAEVKAAAPEPATSASVEIPASKVSSAPPETPTPVTGADKSQLLARLRSIAQNIGEQKSPTIPEGPPLRVAGRAVPADTDLTSALQKSLPQNRVQGKIMQVLRREGPSGMTRLTNAPELQGISREQVQEAVDNLSASGKVMPHEDGIAIKKKR